MDEVLQPDLTAPSVDAIKKAMALKLWPGRDKNGRWFVCESPRGGAVTRPHCGPYKTSREAWDWIVDIRAPGEEDKT